jgi:DNA-binding NarL/FixJ family response regulator
MNPMRLLLIEDQPSAVDLTKRLLGEFASRIDDIGTLEGGIKMAQRFAYDVVILDLRLEDSDRANTIDSIPEVKRAAQAPVVVMTGWPEPGIKEKCLKAGADAFVNKDEITTAIIFAVSLVMKNALDKERSPSFANHMAGLHQRLLRSA